MIVMYLVFRSAVVYPLDHIIDPKHQFPGGKGFGDIVVAPQFQSHDSVQLLIAGGHKYHRYIGAFPDGLDEIKAIDLPAEHDIQEP